MGVGPVHGSADLPVGVSPGPGRVAAWAPSVPSAVVPLCRARGAGRPARRRPEGRRYGKPAADRKVGATADLHDRGPHPGPTRLSADALPGSASRAPGTGGHERILI